ncbi:plasmid pRiA4b ORF-3 family protein [Psychrobacillus sp. L4]|uniref:plasmid pRiA4b ORF-3 family protein n=1 Tax=Psychrobacillus sp. L4 TaxID=3236892 RepID=UPI0036F3BCC3
MKAYQFLITLEEVEPSVWRRFVIPAETTFKRLHDTIQFAMGWQDAHLFEFDFEREQYQLEIVEDEEMYEPHKFDQLNAVRNLHSQIESEFEKRYTQVDAYRNEKSEKYKAPKVRGNIQTICLSI